jgi:hypothetical protein
LKRYDIYEHLADYVYDNDIPKGTEILIEFDGRNICIAEVTCNDEDNIEFKVKALR